MNPVVLRTLGIVAIAFGLLFYLVGVSGLLWHKTPAGDVGLVSVSVVAVLLGAAALQLRHPTS